MNELFFLCNEFDVVLCEFNDVGGWFIKGLLFFFFDWYFIGFLFNIGEFGDLGGFGYLGDGLL